MSHPIIFSLDTLSKEQANFCLTQITEDCFWVKIGHIPFSSLGFSFLKDSLSSFKLLLDFKFFDIPHTIITALQFYKQSFPQIEYFTINGNMDLETLNQLSSLDIGAKAVSVLILSSSTVDITEFLNLARLNYKAGIRNFICPVDYVSTMRIEFGSDITLFSPGIRTLNDKVNDHKSRAQSSFHHLNTDFLIIGRPILESKNPKEKIKEYL